MLALLGMLAYLLWQGLKLPRRASAAQAVRAAHVPLPLPPLTDAPAQREASLPSAGETPAAPTTSAAD